MAPQGHKAKMTDARHYPVSSKDLSEPEIKGDKKAPAGFPQRLQYAL